MAGSSFSRSLVGALMVVFAASGSASAALVVTLNPNQQTFTAGTAATSFFDVFVTGTRVTSPDNVAGYGIEALLAPEGGVTFMDTAQMETRVSTATDAPNGYLVNPSGGITDETPANAQYDLQYADVSPTLGTTPVDTTTTYGAGRIFFEVAANTTPGTYLLTLNPTNTFFVDGSVQPIPVLSLGTATITVLAPAAVPEPTTSLLLALTGVAGFGVKRFRKKRQACATTAA
jgi:hypothetical protein